MRFCPSYNTEDAFPSVVDKAPDIMSTRSGSMIPLRECVLVIGTIVRSATVVPGENDDPRTFG
jgi:hypothetical protein